MDSLKGKIGILLLILCLGIIMAAVWYCLFGLRDSNSMMEGTFVQGMIPLQRMMTL